MQNLWDDRNQKWSYAMVGRRLVLAAMVAMTILTMGLLAPARPVEAIAPEEIPQIQEATQEVQITATPVSARLELEPGKVYTGYITVLNTGKQKFTFNLYAAPYQVSDEEYNPVFDRNIERTQIARWINFSEGSEFTLQYKQQIKVPYTITVPDDAPDGGQYAVIFAETAATTEPQVTGVLSKQRVGTIIYAELEGTTRESGGVESVDISTWQQTSPLTVSWQIRNSGNTDFIASTSMRVVSLFGGHEVYKSQQSRQSPVLPETTRKLSEMWENAPFGIYRVEASASVLGKEQTITTYVLLAPLYVVIIILLFIICILFLLVRTIIHRFTKRRLINKPLGIAEKRQ